MTKKRFLFVMTTLVFISYGAVMFLELGGEQNGLILDFIYVIAPLLAVMCGAICAFPNVKKERFAIGFLTAGMGCMFIGETLWLVFRHWLMIDTYPSLADFFFVLSYPLFFVGLFSRLKSSGVSISMKKYWPILVLIIILIGLVSYFGVYSNYDSESGLLANALSIFYGFGDIILIIGCFFIFMIIMEDEETDGDSVLPWIILSLSFSATLVADIIFSIYAEEYEEILSLKFILDAFWMGGYILFSWSMLYLSKITKEGEENIQENKEAVRELNKEADILLHNNEER